MIMGFVLLGAGRPVSPVPDLDRGRLVCPLRTALCDFNRVRRGVLATMLKSDMLVFLRVKFRTILSSLQLSVQACRRKIKD